MSVFLGRMASRIGFIGSLPGPGLLNHPTPVFLAVYVWLLGPKFVFSPTAWKAPDKGSRKIPVKGSDKGSS